MKKAKKGFTIIELIVVIAIIAVLATIVMINLNGFVEKARNAKRNSDVANYVKAFEMYLADNKEYPKDSIVEGNAERGLEGGQDCCLGDWGSDTCYWGSPEEMCSEVNEAIKEYLPGLPVEKNGVHRTGVGDYYNGYMYSTSMGEPLGHHKIVWILSGENQNCGIINNPRDYWTGNGITSCGYDFDLEN